MHVGTNFLSLSMASRARIFKRLWSPGIDAKASIPLAYVARAGIFKPVWSPGIDAKASIPPAYTVKRVDGKLRQPARMTQYSSIRGTEHLFTC
jgi:hypothetical protein